MHIVYFKRNVTCLKHSVGLYNRESITGFVIQRIKCIRDAF